MAVFGLLSFPAAIWAFAHFMPLMTDLFVLWRAEAYAPAVLEVEWARLDDGHPQAVGRVNGRRETLSLVGWLPRRPTSLNDLQDLMKDVERMDVLYDPAASRTSFEGASVRVVPEVDDLRADRRQRVARTLAFGYGPGVGLILLALVFARLLGRPVGCWIMPGAFFLGVQVLFAVFMIVVDRFLQ